MQRIIALRDITSLSTAASRKEINETQYRKDWLFHWGSKDGWWSKRERHLHLMLYEDLAPSWTSLANFKCALSRGIGGNLSSCSNAWKNLIASSRIFCDTSFWIILNNSVTKKRSGLTNYTEVAKLKNGKIGSRLASDKQKQPNWPKVM